MSCAQVGQLLGDAPRTVAYWVRRFEAEGLAELVDGERPGRPRRLDDEQVTQIDAALRKMPKDFGLTGTLWGRQDAGGLYPSAMGDHLGGTAMSTTLPAIGFSSAQAAWNGRSGRP